MKKPIIYEWECLKWQVETGTNETQQNLQERKQNRKISFHLFIPPRIET